MSEHGVEHDDEFAHAGGERDLGFLARRKQARVNATEMRSCSILGCRGREK